MSDYMPQERPARELCQRLQADRTSPDRGSPWLCLLDARLGPEETGLAYATAGVASGRIPAVQVGASEGDITALTAGDFM
jgi:hypothetical protein